MSAKFWVRVSDRFDGVHHHVTAQLLCNDHVLDEEHGIQSTETGYPSQESLTELVMERAHYNLTQLREKLKKPT